MTRLADIAQGVWSWAMAHAQLGATVAIVAVLGVVASLLAARLLRYLVLRSGAEALLARMGVASLLNAVGWTRGPAHLAGQVALLAGLLLTVSVVADLLSLTALSNAIGAAAAYMPRLLAAVAVLLAGLAGATVVRRLVGGAAGKRKDLEARGVVARASYYVLVVVALAWGAEQAGMETEIISSLIKILLGVGIAGFALSAALGFRSVFQNIAARHYYERVLQPGDVVRVGDVEGMVLQYTPVALILRSGRSEYVVPCALLLQANIRVDRVARPDSDPSSTIDGEPLSG